MDIRFDFDGTNAQGITRRRWHEIRWLAPPAADVLPYAAQLGGLKVNSHFPKCGSCAAPTPAGAACARRPHRVNVRGVPGGEQATCAALVCPACSRSLADASRDPACAACNSSLSTLGVACRLGVATPYGAHTVTALGPRHTANGAVGACSKCGAPCTHPLNANPSLAYRTCNRPVR
eukprot:gene11357-17750_t